MLLRLIHVVEYYQYTPLYHWIIFYFMYTPHFCLPIQLIRHLGCCEYSWIDYYVSILLEMIYNFKWWVVVILCLVLWGTPKHFQKQLNNMPLYCQITAKKIVKTVNLISYDHYCFNGISVALIKWQSAFLYFKII